MSKNTEESGGNMTPQSGNLSFRVKSRAVQPSSLDTDSQHSGDSTRTMINQYLRGPLAGAGQHGTVYHCWDTTANRQEVAIKIVKRNNPRAEKMALLRQQNQRNTSSNVALKDKLGPAEYKIRKEIAIMTKCRHPHVVELLEVIDDKQNEKVYMVMEYLGGGEIKWRNSSGQPTLHVNQSRRICRDVILGLEYLHHQGIIHRDIKPANLMWTSDRRAVKITDFGVSHFSYAQRLQAAGSETELDDPNDPILLDDSDLSKMSGTPGFIAPEVTIEPVPESTDHTPNTSSSTLQLVWKRPPITKQIDIWALGCTLYCLLFGHVPFVAVEDENPNLIHREYMLYQTIQTQDWVPDANMGFDQTPTGGRHPSNRSSEGAKVMAILDGMLRKDVNERTKLDDLKRHQWFLRDIENPELWIRKTSPIHSDKVSLTGGDMDSVMSPLRFSWAWNKDRLKSFFRTVRGPRHSARSSHKAHKLGASGERRQTNFGATSEPGMDRRYKASARAGDSKPPRSIVFSAKEKGKGRATSIAGSSSGITSAPAARPRALSLYRSPPPKKRRGSETHLPHSQPLHVVAQSLNAADESATFERQRTRRGFTFLRWRSPIHSPGPSSVQTSACSSPGAQLSPTSSTGPGDSLLRRSEEGLNRYGVVSRRSTSSGRLTAARRASSWGEPVDYVGDAMSLAGEGIDDETMIVGAGGYTTDADFPPPLSVSQSLASMAEIAGNMPPSMLQSGYLYTSPSAIPPAPDRSAHDTSRQVQMRGPTGTTSPLVNEAWGQSLRIDDDDDDDLSSFDSWANGQSHGEGLYGTEDLGEDDVEDGDEDDEEAIEIRRRPSVSVTAASPPVHLDSDES